MDGQHISHAQKQWLFGPNWPGRRCLAKTRRGTLCQKPALTGRTRCQLHGGRAGAPSGPRNGAWRHGNYCREKLESDKAARVRIRHLAMISKMMQAVDKLTTRNPARANFMRSVVCDEVNRLYLADK